MSNHRLTKALVKHLLERPETMEWTLQGFGMLRCYLEPELRLHVWDSRFRAADVSDLHTHPWDFTSHVIVGRVSDHRFVESDGTSKGTGQAIPRKRQTIRCGEGGGLVGEPVDVFLAERPTETFEEGDHYDHLAEEIHRSIPEDGTVTLVERDFREDTDHAFVYFRGEWVSAEPRPATPAEVDVIVSASLEQWF